MLIVHVVLGADDFLLPLHACRQRHDRNVSLALLKGNTLLHTNDAAIWEVNAMAIALWVKTDPMAIACAHVELRAQCIMHLYTTAPCRYVL